jgi:NAD(P)-dependent dehydrogenase (short-subunit alcohol dehydrogenase family)
MQSEDLPPVPRFVMATAEAPLRPEALDVVKGRTLLITDDEGGVARVAATVLRGHGARVVLVRLRPDTCLEGDVLETDLTDVAKVTELVVMIRQMHGAIDGVLHLLPLRSAPRFEDMDRNTWRDCLHADVMSLFHLAKSAAPVAAGPPAGRTAPKWLIAATSLGAAFGGAYNQSLSPTHGGVAGLMKALATEQAARRVKVVDLDRTHDPEEMAAHLLAELTAADDLAEVAYDGLRRIVLRPIPAAPPSEPIARVTSDSVILITGGARGITAEIAKELAERYQPTLVLLGRSLLPPPSEAADTASVRSPHQLKRALMQRLQRTGDEVSAVRLEALYRNLLKEREIRATIDAIQTVGARCHYLKVDVRDDQAFGDAIDQIYRNHGRLDGVIHAAGVLEDRLARDKTPESFLRVLETKVLGAFTLAQRLRPETLGFLCFFSSVAGRFGNAGQTDYAAANEILNKVAVKLDGQWPGRVFAVNWGPWNSVGMVSPEIERKFLDSGVKLIPPAAGRLAFDEELRFGRKGETEVILGAAASSRRQSRQMKHARLDCPLLNGGSLARRADTEIEFVRTLDPERDAYLQDHRLDGQFVFPMAMAMELAAEVVQRGWPESEFQGIQSLSVLAGIAFERETTVRVVARPHTRRLGESVARSMDVEIAELHRPERPSYRAIVQMGDGLPSSSSTLDGALSDLEPFPLTVDESYRRWLFHGPRFQGILAVEGLNERGIRGLLRPSAPAQCLEPSAGGTWLIDPVLLDCGLQLAILWHRAQHDMTPLPSRFASYRRFGRADENDVRCSLHAASARGGYTLSTTIWFSDAASGRVLSVLEGVEFSCTQSLNRLAHLAPSHSR